MLRDLRLSRHSLQQHCGSDLRPTVATGWNCNLQLQKCAKHTTLQVSNELLLPKQHVRPRSEGNCQCGSNVASKVALCRISCPPPPSPSWDRFIIRPARRGSRECMRGTQLPRGTKGDQHSTHLHLPTPIPGGRSQTHNGKKTGAT